MSDSINAIFELGGAFVLLLNIRQLRIDREVKGVDWRTVLFFTTWGIWNIIYYPAINQPVSAYAAIGLVTVNNVWLMHLVYYQWLDRQREKATLRQPLATDLLADSRLETTR